MSRMFPGRFVTHEDYLRFLEQECVAIERFYLFDLASGEYGPFEPADHEPGAYFAEVIRLARVGLKAEEVFRDTPLLARQ
jgi:hypothetical protein